MKVYFACSSFKIRDYLFRYNSIREELKSRRHTIVADWIDRSFNRTSNNQLSKAQRVGIRDEGIKAINNCDFLVADVSFPSSSVGFQIGWALSKKIPVLCLYSEEFGNKKVPQVIRVINSPLLVISAYNSGNIRGVVKNFTKNLPTNKLIKFNFIITPQIAEYLNRGSVQGKISKSDFLREILEKIIKYEDRNYRS